MVRERISASPTTLTARLEQAFASRLDELPEETRSALLRQRSTAGRPLDEILKCARRLRWGFGSRRRRCSPRSRPAHRHRRGRSALSPPADPLGGAAGRSRTDTRNVCGPGHVVADPERRLWHRAMSAEGADEEIAAALENHARYGAGPWRGHGGGAALERAAALTADATRRAGGSWAPLRLPTSSGSSSVSPAARREQGRWSSTRSRRRGLPGCSR